MADTNKFCHPSRICAVGVAKENSNKVRLVDTVVVAVGTHHIHGAHEEEVCEEGGVRCV